MGCDIHLYTEARTKINDKEQWINIDRWKINPWFNEEGPLV